MNIVKLLEMAQELIKSMVTDGFDNHIFFLIGYKRRRVWDGNFEYNSSESFWNVFEVTFS